MLIVENFDSFKNLTQLSYDIIDNWSKKIKEYFQKKLLQDPKLKNSFTDNPIYILDYVPPFTLNSENLKLKYNDKINDFIKNFSLEIKLDLSKKNKNIRGHFITGYYVNEIILYLDYDELKKISFDEKDSFNYLNFYSILITHKDTLDHEIKHALDYHISNTKAFYTKQNISHFKKKRQNSYNSVKDRDIDYLKLPHEINARFHATLVKLSEQKYYLESWENFLKGFKDIFNGWDLLSDEQKKKIINKIYIIYDNLSKKPKLTLKEILEFIKRIKNKYDVNLEYNEKDHIILVNWDHVNNKLLNIFIKYNKIYKLSFAFKKIDDKWLNKYDNIEETDILKIFYDIDYIYWLK